MRSKVGFSAVVFALGLVAGALLHFVIQDRDDTDLAAPAPAEGGAQHEESGTVEVNVAAQRNAGITVQPATLRDIQTTLSATGVVAPDQTRVARIRPLARGVVEKVNVQPGDRVRAGDPLIEYDNIELGLAIGEYQSAKAELERALTELEVKRTILARSTKMLEVGATAQTTHDVRRAEFEDAQALVSSRRAMAAKIEEQLHRFGLTEEDIGELQSGHAAEDVSNSYHRTESHNTLKAPFSGVITAYDVAEGELITPSDELLTVADISSVWVLAGVYERDLAHVRLGQPVDIRIASFPEEIFRGRITYVSDVIEPSTRTARVRCVVRNPGSRLKLGMFATVEIPTTRTQQVLAVPSTAIQRVDDRLVVFVRATETEFGARDVQTGLTSEGWVQIEAGLQPGEVVVAENSFHLKTALLRELIGDEH